jgi:uncharacterized membrane protein YfcA
MEVISSVLTEYSISTIDILLLLLCGLLIGAAKAGVKGLGNITVPVMALVFGARPSTGILLPILILADSGAIIYYRKNADWAHLKKLLPAAIVGVIGATFLGNRLSDLSFQYLMGFLILFGLVLLIVWEKYNKRLADTPIKHFGPGMGMLAGFSTMMGNMAGPIVNIYLLVSRLPKNVFIATSAWFFYFINIVKIPFHVIFWHTITWKTLLISLIAVPGILLGLLLGIYFVKWMSETFFRNLVIATTTLGALLLFIN